MKRIGPNRGLLIMVGIVIVAGLVACNSNETLLSQRPPPSQTPPDARRITADELHKLWEKNEVVIIDTRPEPAYKQEHIKGSISMPTGSLLQHIDELPKDKLIAAYCT